MLQLYYVAFCRLLEIGLLFHFLNILIKNTGNRAGNVFVAGHAVHEVMIQPYFVVNGDQLVLDQVGVVVDVLQDLLADGYEVLGFYLAYFENCLVEHVVG